MTQDLFAGVQDGQPLAARMRPTSLADFVGQSHLLGPQQPLRQTIESGRVHSMILWGPPGVGKTTLAKLLAHYVEAHFLSVSAVLSGVKDIRQAVEVARVNRQGGRATLLFVDEVHRFNKAQQDAFLPHIEDGTFIFIGATTENPSFELNNALLSRARVYVLKALTETDLMQLLRRAASDDQVMQSLTVDAEALLRIAKWADGDARRALNLLEVSLELARANGLDRIESATLDQALDANTRRFDKGGDGFYDQISALHKSVRGSSVDGALYWLARMLDGGCDPLYIARRVVRMASEDIGNADPRGLQIALNAWDAQTRLGSPEGELAIAQAVAYLAAAPKSNAVYMAFKAIQKQVAAEPSYEVPIHLRNAPTTLMKAQGYGAEYHYAHDYPDAYVPGESYLPRPIQNACWYQPVPRGLEIRIGEKMSHLKHQDQMADWQRYHSNDKLDDKTKEDSPQGGKS